MHLGKYLGSCKNLEQRYGFTIDCCGECKKEMEDGIAPVGYYTTTDGYYVLCCKHSKAVKTLEFDKEVEEKKIIHWKFS